MANRIAEMQPQTTELLPTLFNPKSIAIIGASRDEKSVSFGMLKNLLLGNFKGRLYPVNPKADSILGLKAYKSVLETASVFPSSSPWATRPCSMKTTC